eukprot:1558711-Pyramimonas_sp.AAC.1
MHSDLSRLGWHLEASQCNEAGIVFGRSYYLSVIGVFRFSSAASVVCSLYLPDILSDDCELESELVFMRVSDQFGRLRGSYRQASLVCMLDADVELPPSCELMLQGVSFLATG